MTKKVILLVAGGVFAATALTAVLLVWPSRNVPEYAAIKQQWRSSEATLLDRHGEVLDRQRTDFNTRRTEWVALEDISPALLTAVVDGEDRNFWQHRGVDWLAVIGAVRDQTLTGQRRGASTISMQVALQIALIDPQRPAKWKQRTWRRKFAQVRLARGIEGRWTKQQILETYLNLLGYRGEVQGIGAAAQVMAGKNPAGLSLPESLVLAALLPAPSAEADRVIARACSRAKTRHLSVDCDTLRTTATALLANGRKRQDISDDPNLTPQLAHRLLRQPGERVTTTLDKRAQRLALETLTRHLATLEGRNVRDGAALVVDNATGEVLAYVGSAGPSSRAREVDGVRAHRQAGSTLKPFLYELALERRYLTAASLLDDSPIALDSATGVYLPQNYDRDFKGMVSVRTALASSLNIPAVRTLVLVGVEPFRERLYELGYHGITEDGEFYGYSLALGSAEVSLWEQVQAYRALARGGRWSALTLHKTTTPADEHATLPADASFIITDILSDRAARALTFGLNNHLTTAFWSAAKTGTSKDMRDNWCIGFSSRFTVGVWVGNFEGDSMHDVTGVTGAAPVWSEIMTALHVNEPSVQPRIPTGVTNKIANFSPAVEAPRQEWFLSGTEVAQFTTFAAQTRSAKISSPANGLIIAVDPDIPPNQQRVPFNAEGADSKMRFRLNGAAMGAANQNLMWAPKPGAYRLELVSQDNRVQDQISFIVR